MARSKSGIGHQATWENHLIARGLSGNTAAAGGVLVPDVSGQGFFDKARATDGPLNRCLQFSR